jgi:hypothetical protein
MPETTTAPTTDKASLRSDLERTHAAYRDLIAEIPDDRWGATSGNTAFTVGQLAWHIASGLDFGAELIENAHKGKQTTIPSFLMPLGYKINEFRIKRRSKAATRDSVLADYDRDHARLIRLLDEVTDAELAIVKTNYAMTQSVAEMFRTPVDHFAEHAPEIRSAL